MSSTETERAGEWSPLHIYLPMSLQPGFLRDVIHPVVREAGVRNRFWYLRYWQGGPHIRFRLHEASEQTVEWVRSRLAAAMPALDAEQTAEYAQQSAHQPGLAELEGAKPEDVRAPGTVEAARYSPEYAKYGGTTGLRIAEELFRSTSTAVLDLLAGLTDRQLTASPAGPAIRVMAMSLKGSGLNMAQSQDFLSDYEENWRRWVPPGYEEHWAAMYEKTRNRVTNLCGAVWRDGTTDVFHDTYAAALHSTRMAQAESSEGDLAELVLDETPYAHCVANYIHTTNNRLGILPAAEAFLAYVIQRSLAELRGTTPDPNGIR
ncbi:thiopeptide-type bacteriocin biosynthesis protein [Streptomyces auratus]|uniref:Thiopeptide-type bacteriocin biosynthesis protein n=2 Tax=Streptomyces auratus AGR0001 TaxID=1160718 RepID=A0A8B1NA93_9ACTN|nr:thiopeptide-type bacteriocin biosynthesis protein [Streptomyces auratus]QTZ92459.1 thiopeptide-type bacteriocin biosynthesis protein [Streptomyces auratus AGR0001]